MSTRSNWQPWLLALTCAALLWARAGGTHLHLCFDGLEQPASLHLAHGNGHAEHHQDHVDHGGSHNDLDVPTADQALAKPGKPLPDLPLFLIAALCIALISVSRTGPPPREAPRALASAGARLRPPLRGPPLSGAHA